MKPDDTPFWNVRHYGAVGDREANDREAIQQAIDACGEAGGGTIILPAGDYRTGTLHLRDCVTLCLEAGATVWGSTDRSDYDVPHLIYAKGVRDVSVLGSGRIDGQGEAFWVQEGERLRPAGFRPEQLLHFEECENVRMRDLTVTNSPGWTLHLFRCNGATLSGVTILNHPYGPNTDGIDPNCSTNVHISDCHIVAGDDCIVLKATEAYPCENVTVTNCTLETTCAALKLGTESHGDFRHCLFSNCTIRNTASGITLFAKDGGRMEDILFSNITIDTKPAHLFDHREWPIYIDLERREKESKVGAIRDVTFSNISIRTHGRCIAQGLASQPLERLTLENVRVKVAGFEDLEGIGKPRGGTTYWDDPEGGRHWAAPAHLIFSNVKGLTLRNVEVVPDTEEAPLERSALLCDNVEDVEIEGFRGRQAVPEGTSPAIDLRNCRDAFFRGCRAPEGTGTFLQVNGKESGNIALMGNDLSKAARAVATGPGVNEEALYQVANRLP